MSCSICRIAGHRAPACQSHLIMEKARVLWETIDVIMQETCRCIVRSQFGENYGMYRFRLSADRRIRATCRRRLQDINFSLWKRIMPMFKNVDLFQRPHRVQELSCIIYFFRYSAERDFLQPKHKTHFFNMFCQLTKFIVYKKLETLYGINPSILGSHEAYQAYRQHVIQQPAADEQQPVIQQSAADEQQLVIQQSAAAYEQQLEENLTIADTDFTPTEFSLEIFDTENEDNGDQEDTNDTHSLPPDNIHIDPQVHQIRLPSGIILNIETNSNSREQINAPSTPPSNTTSEPVLPPAAPPRRGRGRPPRIPGAENVTVTRGRPPARSDRQLMRRLAREDPHIERRRIMKERLTYKMDGSDAIYHNEDEGCPICCEDMKGESMFAVQCGHPFCADCLGNVINKSAPKCPMCREDICAIHFKQGLAPEPFNHLMKAISNQE